MFLISTAARRVFFFFFFLLPTLLLKLSGPFFFFFLNNVVVVVVVRRGCSVYDVMGSTNAVIQHESSRAAAGQDMHGSYRGSNTSDSASPQGGGGGVMSPTIHRNIYTIKNLQSYLPPPPQ